MSPKALTGALSGAGAPENSVVTSGYRPRAWRRVTQHGSETSGTPRANLLVQSPEPKPSCAERKLMLSTARPSGTGSSQPSSAQAVCKLRFRTENQHYREICGVHGLSAVLWLSRAVVSQSERRTCLPLHVGWALGC